MPSRLLSAADERARAARAAVAAVVAQQVGGLAVVGHEQIQVAVVVDVAGDEPAADLLQREPGPGAAADLDEAAGRSVAEQQVALRVVRAGAEQRRVVDDVAVDDGEVEPRVVVEVEEATPKPTNGSVGGPMPLSSVASANSPSPRLRNRLCVSNSWLVTTRSSRPSPS